MASQTTELTSAASLAGTLWTDRERDACGMGFVARRDARYTREVVQLALDAVEHLAHRGAVDAGADDGSEPTGDGAGIMTAIPWSLFAGVAPDVEARGARGDLGVGMCFLARERAQRVEAMRTIEETAHALGVEVVGWRDVPTDDDALGAAARATRPYVMQVLFGRPDHVELESFEALLYRVRREIDREVRDIPGRVYVNSLSSRRIVYKGLLVARQLRRYYPDLDRDDFTSPYAVFHQRYSTNTFPTWERAQPCRMLAHNGEINTLRGNVSWMRARGEHLGWPAGRTGPDDDGSWLVPVIDERGSDSAMLDDVTQLLVHAGRELPEALTVLVPPAWDHDQDIEPHVRDLLRKNSATSEPWDGPAAIAFADGRQVGTCLDRNGLRPARWIETTDGLVACASEYGAVRVDDARVLRSGRLGPGQMLVVDLRDGSMRTGDDVVHELAAREPWGIVVAAQQLHVPDATLAGPTPLDADRATRPIAGDQALFGYSREELTAVLRPMVTSGVPPVGSMGDDTPLSALATEHRSLFGFVRQAFAEVTNPPIDPLRERLSMSLDTLVGPRPRLLQPDGAGWPALHLRSPLVTSAGLWRLRDLAQRSGMTVTDITTVLPGPTPDATDIAHAIETVCADALAAVAAGADVLVLSDRDATPDAPPLPALLVASGVHQALVRERVRARVGLVIDSGEPREPHHVAALVGHGADVVCPWLALDTVTELAEGPRSRLEIDGPAAQFQLLLALEYGLRTAMSRMGISTLDGYRGAHVFEVVGLDPAVAARHFTDITLRPGSTGYAWMGARATRHAAAARAWFGAPDDRANALASPGFYKFRRGGEQHAFEPAMVTALHAAVGVEDPLGAGFGAAREHYATYRDLVHDRPAVDPRDLLRLHPAPGMAPVPLDEVEPASAIVRRFSTGAMSHGSLSAEAHETLAAAMHLVGGASNSGEGGESAERFGTNLQSDIKQVASGRFGVTPAYLRSAKELQIKMAQGSKPGEGGQLPGHKVSEEIARIRHTTPGVSLISPPPHHDIYSIEDLAQLAFDLQSVHPTARISVKLVSQAGVGTIAAGVAKARVATIIISGSDGGTGASPLGSIKHAGMPWEWGIAETQQVLVANRLRGRVRLRVDGGLRTGRDVIVAALLGGDEFSFGTSALIAAGCKMARTCHNDQCPVGIATQNPELRALFPGRPDQVAAYLMLIAEEVRELLASLGARSLDEVIGRPELLAVDADHPAAGALDFSAMLATPGVPFEWPRRDHGEPNRPTGVDHGLDARLARMVGTGLDALAAGGEPIHVQRTIFNDDRTLGARLSGDIAERIGRHGLAPGSVHLEFTGIAGQSLAAFAIRGVRISLSGAANDFVGKGLAGAEVELRFPPGGALAADASANVIAGNACLYGATSGTLLASGAVGERFAVRNSGADAVVEGAGDHLCEYMTGGTVVVLGDTGRNVASGMSGGALWVLVDTDDDLLRTRLARTARIAEPDAGQVTHLRELLARHAERTGSVRANDLLAAPGKLAARFALVLPS